MIIKNEILRDRIFYWLLAFCLVSLPFPSYSFNSQALILFVAYWIFYNPFAEKRQLLIQNKIPIMILTSLFWIPLLGVVYTDNYGGAFKDIQLKLPFLLFPLTLLTVPLRLHTRKFVLNSFSIAVVAASLLAIIKVGYFKWKGLGNYFYYQRFSEFLDKHTTYFSLFIVICLLWLLWSIIHKKRNTLLLALIGFVLLYMIYILSVRISIMALVAGSLLIVFSSIMSIRRKAIILVLIPILLGSLYFTPHFKKRFEPSTTEASELHDFDYRELHWKAVFETIKQNNFVFGNGTRSHRDFLYDRYKEYGLSSAYTEKYNAHNQYLEVLLDFGILGFSALVSLILFLAWKFIKRKDYFALSILLVFLIYMITESIFQRHSGIVIFSYLTALFLNTNSLRENLN